MILSKIYKNTLLIIAACLVLTACATKKEVATPKIVSFEFVNLNEPGLLKS